MNKNSLVTLLLAAPALLGTTASFAKDKVASSDKHRFYIKVGAGALPTDVLARTPIDEYRRQAYDKSISYNASIQYFVSKNFAVSVTAGTYKFADNYNIYQPSTSSPSGPELLGYNYQYSGKTTYVAAEGTVIYCRMPRVALQFYGTAGIAKTTTTTSAANIGAIYSEPVQFLTCGLGYDPSPKTRKQVKGQVTVLGLRGGNKITWYAEAGYGYKGIANAGIGYRL